MRLAKWLRMTLRNLFHRNRITPAVESNDVLVLEKDDFPKLKIDCFFPEQEVVNGINKIHICLNEAVEQGDVLVGFFEVVDDNFVWLTIPVQDVFCYGPLITVPCPRYRLTEIDQPAITYLQVWRLSDGATTLAKSFKFLPVVSGVRILDYVPQNSCANGDELVFLACSEIINLDDFQVRIFEKLNGKIVWKEFAEIDHITSIEYAPLICIQCPSYKSLDIDIPVQTYIQCRRPSDGAISRPVRFIYTPLETGEPLPLMRICRRAIRQIIGDDHVEERIDCLELPEQMKMYLLQRT